MTDKELRRLSRADLLELLLVQRKENEQLRCILDQTQAQLADRTIRLDNIGSIAEASLELSGVFAAAQKAADLYLEAARKKADQIVKEAERQASALSDTREEDPQKSEKIWGVLEEL